MKPNNKTTTKKTCLTEPMEHPIECNPIPTFSPTFGDYVGLIRSGIKKKYGSIFNFCNHFGLNYYTATNALNNRLNPTKTFLVFDSMVENLNSAPSPICSNCITNDERESIRVGIATKFRTIKSFVEQNPQHTYPFVHNVISGKRKLADARFIKLFNDVVK
jgi:hypothetical protein